VPQLLRFLAKKKKSADTCEVSCELLTMLMGNAGDIFTQVQFFEADGEAVVEACAASATTKAALKKVLKPGENFFMQPASACGWHIVQPLTMVCIVQLSWRSRRLGWRPRLHLVSTSTFT
jgi:hypothetical protein